MSTAPARRPRRRLLVLAAAAVLAAVVLLWLTPWGEEARGLVAQGALTDLVARAGPWGPLLLIALMTLAIVASPIPSAPIALVAGAAYGHWWGTLIVVAGAQAGAVIAFAIARILGAEAMRRRFGDRVTQGLAGSQWALMGTVFVSRLLPFVSFDLISYAAGLTVLRPWRFFVATLAGVLPASFLLTHFGGTLTGGNATRAGLAVLGLGLVTGLPLAWAAWRRHRA